MNRACASRRKRRARASRGTSPTSRAPRKPKPKKSAKAAKFNKYEWEPGAAHNPEFTTKGTTAELNSGETKVKCKKTVGKGKVTGTQTSEAKFTFTGCELVGGTKIKCQTHGAVAGEIETGKLEGTLSEHGTEVWANYAAKPGKETTPPWAAFECVQTGSFTISGHVAGVSSTTPNAMSKKGGFAFAEGTGEQDLIEAFFNNRTLEEEEESLTLINSQSIKYAQSSETRTEVKPAE